MRLHGPSKHSWNRGAPITKKKIEQNIRKDHQKFQCSEQEHQNRTSYQARAKKKAKYTRAGIFRKHSWDDIQHIL